MEGCTQKMDGGMSKGQRNQLEGDPNVQSRNNLSNKMIHWIYLTEKNKNPWFHKHKEIIEYTTKWE